MTPDEVRSAIAANPQTPTERARLINEAIDNNMADEIPEDWGIGVGQGPDEPVAQTVHQYIQMETTSGTLYLVLYTDGTLAITNEGGGTIYEFSREQFWADTEMVSLEDSLTWAQDVATKSSDFLITLGERPIDQTNLLYSWVTMATGPGSSPAIIVGINDQLRATLRIQEQLYPITDLDELSDIIGDVGWLTDILRNDFS